MALPQLDGDFDPRDETVALAEVRVCREWMAAGVKCKTLPQTTLWARLLWFSVDQDRRDASLMLHLSRARVGRRVHW